MVQGRIASSPVAQDDISNPTPQPPEEEKEKPKRVDADVLIPGRGQPTKDASLVWKKGKILYAGATASLPKEYESLDTVTHVPVLMPGMWDCHVHFLGVNSTNIGRLPLERSSLHGARTAKDLAATLNAGFTSVRELAGYGIDIATAVNEGWLPGPNIYSAGAILSQTGGHADVHDVPYSLVVEKMHEGLPFQVCDGVSDCLKTTRLQVRRGAKVIKVCATGGVLSQIDSPQAPEFSPEELKAIVDEAARTRMVVAAHAHGNEGILAALHAGVKTIEHGSFLDSASIDLMVKNDAILVATRTIIEYGLANPSNFGTPRNYAKLLETAASHKRAYAAAVKAGVKIALGTDIAFSSNDIPLRHGQNGQEFKYAVEAGLSPLDAIEAGTANAPETLGEFMAPKSGQLRQGFDADFIALERSPLDDEEGGVEVLGDPDNVAWVWKGGVCFKEPGKTVSWLQQ